MSNGTEDASGVQPTKAGRGTRLSFLGGRRKESSGDIPLQPNGDAEASPRRPTAKDTTLHRRSFFRSHSNDQTQPQSQANGHDGADWVTDSGGRTSTDTGLTDKEQGERSPGLVKMGSVRKRLSMLKIGKKNSKGTDLMGSLDEE